MQDSAALQPDSTARHVGRRLEEISAACGCECVLRDTTSGCQLTRSLGGEMLRLWKRVFQENRPKAAGRGCPRGIPKAAVTRSFLEPSSQRPQVLSECFDECRLGLGHSNALLRRHILSSRTPVPRPCSLRAWKSTRAAADLEMAALDRAANRAP